MNSRQTAPSLCLEKGQRPEQLQKKGHHPALSTYVTYENVQLHSPEKQMYLFFQIRLALLNYLESDVVSKEEEVMYFVEGHVIGLFEGVEKRDGRQTKQ